MKSVNPKVLFLFIFIVVCHLLFNQTLQLHFDEAYYWVWSKNLQLSYFDHPPMIAYMIKLATLFSNKEFFVRLPSVFCATMTVVMIYKSAKVLFGQKAGDIAIILALSWPILEGVFFITTIDSPLFMFWSITVYCLINGFVLDRRIYIYLSGIALGLALLSKYTAILILPGVLIYLLLSRTHRKLLLSVDIYFALVLTVAIFTPVIIWNYQHDWSSFIFQFKHGVADDKHFNIESFSGYIGAFLGAANPFISLPIFVFLWKQRKEILHNNAKLFLLSQFLFIFIFFAYNSLYKFQEANWAAPAYIAGIIFLAGVLSSTNIKWIHRYAIGLILILLPVVKMPEVFLPRIMQSKIPSIDAFMGNKQLYRQIQSNYLKPDDVIIACNYKVASRGWYYLGKQVHVLDGFKNNSYHFWNSDLKYPIKEALYFCEGDGRDNIEMLSKYFTLIKPVGIVKYRDSFVNNKLYIYRLGN
ncbi:MAG: glycosyltransferase family 39 protein [Burkholderiales bacterium]|nr:glycosyltransferase family 39 protein [Burkholderiales bacterium]